MADAVTPRKKSRGHPQPDSPNPSVPPLRITLLGGFQVAIGDEPIPATRWRLRKAAHLLKLLALAPGHSLHREQLLDALWPDLEPAAAARNLRYALHVALGLAGPLLVDVAAFSAAAADARRAATPDAYEAALARYHGELLPEDRYED